MRRGIIKPKYRIREFNGLFYPQYKSMFFGYCDFSDEDEITNFNTLEEARDYIKKRINKVERIYHAF